MPGTAAANSSTRSIGTLAIGIPASKAACAALATTVNDIPATGTEIGTTPVNQPVVWKSAGVRLVVVGVITL